jgi:hypothetical protein
MPRYRITDSTSGRTLLVEGPSAPTEADAAELFGAAPAAVAEQPAPAIAIPEALPPERAPIQQRLELPLGDAPGAGATVYNEPSPEMQDAALRLGIPAAAVAFAPVTGGASLLLGGAGAFTGEILAQQNQMERGARDTMGVGSLVAAPLIAATPLGGPVKGGMAAFGSGGRLVAAAPQAIAKRAAFGGGINATADALQQQIDTGTIDGGQLAASAGMGALFGAVMGSAETLKATAAGRDTLLRMRRAMQDFSSTDEQIVAAARAARAARTNPSAPAKPNAGQAVAPEAGANVPASRPALPAPAAPVQSVEDILIPRPAPRPAPPAAPAAPAPLTPAAVDPAPPPPAVILSAPETPAPTVADSLPATTTALSPTEHPVIEFPVGEIQVNQDIQQFKGEADTATGVVDALAGKFERLGTAPIVLWQKLSGQTEVITGRHRLDLARRSGEATIPAQVVRESDGFTQQMALTFDAESNIRDGQGTVKDYAHYFRNSPGLLPADADARGLRARAKGQAGWALGRDASDDLYTGYANSQISEPKAVAIASAAPGNPAAQASAMRQAKTMTAPELAFYTKNLARLSGGAAGGGGEQLGFGGIAEDFAAFEAQAAKIAAVQAERLRQNNELIMAAQGAAKRPEAARQMGLPVDNPLELNQRIAELKKANAALTNPDPDTYAELAAAAGVDLAPRAPEPAPAPVDAPPPVDPNQVDMFGDMPPAAPPTGLDQFNGSALLPAAEKLDLPVQAEAVAAPKSYRQSQVEWGEANLPFGQTAVIESGKGSSEAMSALTRSFISVSDALKIINGERPFPTREQYIKGIERAYINDAFTALEKVEREMRTLGLDTRKAKMPKQDDYATAREFYEAAQALESRARNEGVSLYSALVETKQAARPFPPSPETMSRAAMLLELKQAGIVKDFNDLPLTKATAGQLRERVKNLRHQQANKAPPPPNRGPRDPEAGGIDPQLLVPLARAVVGGVFGALQGDTAEEKLAYALTGMGLGLAASRRLARSALAKLNGSRPLPPPPFKFDPRSPTVAMSKSVVAGRSTLGALEHVRAIEMPELVQLARVLSGQDVQLKTLPKSAGLFKAAGPDFRVILDRRIFADPVWAQQVMAHELGHLVDYMDGHTLNRGNILGRIAVLRGYLAQTLPDTPWSPNQALTPKDRATLRREAEKQVGKRPPKDEEADLAAWQEEVARVYGEKIQEAIDSRGLIVEHEARAQLVELTQWWNPWDETAVSESYNDYRKSSVELYAEALSVMMNAPAELRDRAPTFWKSFTAYFDRKPEAKAALQDMWHFLHQGQKAVVVARNDRLKAGFATAEEFLIDHAREREQARTSLRGIVNQFKQEWWNIYQPIIERGQQVKAAGVKLPWHKDPEAFFDAHPLANNDHYLWIENLQRRIINPIEATGLHRDDLGLHLFHHRVLNESYTTQEGEQAGRSVIANPQGITPLQARIALLNQRLTLGAPRQQALEEAAAKVQDAFFDLVRDGHAAGIFSDEQLAMAQANKRAYAPFAVVDYLLASDHVPAGIKQQLGTLKDVANPFLTFALKGLSVQKLAEFNRAKVLTVDLLLQYFSTEIQRAPEKKLMLAGGGMLTRAAPPPRGMAELVVMRKGKPETYHVDPTIAKMFDDQMPAAALAATRVLNYGFRNFLHHLFITYNPGFVYALNPMADNFRSYYSLPPGVKRRQWIGEQRKAWDTAKSRVMQNVAAQDFPRRRALQDLRKQRPLTAEETTELAALDAKGLAFELLGTRTITSPFDSFIHTGGSDDGFWGELLRTHALVPNEHGRLEQLIAKLGPVRAILKRIERDGLISEALPKTAAYSAMVRGQKWQRRTAATYVRNHIGTPNFTKKGSRAIVHGSVFPYLNIFLRGMESDFTAGTGAAPGPTSGKRKTFEFWRRMSEAVLTPSVLQALAAAGALGVGLKKIYDGFSDYDKTNFLIIPLGTTASDQPGGYKSVGIRLRIPETGRLLNGLIYHSVQRAANDDPVASAGLASLFDFGAGQVPGVNPFIKLGYGWSSYAAGHQPQDWFRGQPVVSNAQWNAGGWDRLSGMLAYSWNEVGLGGLARFDPKSGNVMEFTASATPVLNRLLKITDAGLTEHENKLQEKERQDYAAVRAAMPDHVNGLLQEFGALQNYGDRRTPQQEQRYRMLESWHSGVWTQYYQQMKDSPRSGWKQTGQAVGDISRAYAPR